MNILSLLTTILPTILDRILPGESQEVKAKRLEIQAQVIQGVLDNQTEQVKTNGVEAGSEDWFVRRWRPFIGWICGFGFAYTFLLAPILNWILIMNNLPTLPEFGSEELTTVLMGMLGLGSLRTIEKLKK